MLIESRLPNNALVSGNIDNDQCVKAKQWADQYLSSLIEIPVRVDVDKLLSRTAHLRNEIEQVQFINKWLIADQEEKFRVIYNRLDRNTFLEWFGDELNQIRPALNITESSTEDNMFLADEDAFLYYDGSKLVLTDEQELTLKSIAYSIKTFLNRKGEGALKEFFSVPCSKTKADFGCAC